MKAPKRQTDAVTAPRPRPAKRYTRAAAFDHPGDNQAAWRDRVLGIVRWVAVGVDPNRP